MPSDFAGNSRSGARNLNALSGIRTFLDFVGGADTQDYYRFSLASRRVFSLLLNGMTADADVQLLNSAGSVITSSTRSGNSPDSITRTLDAGTYFVRVYRSGVSNTNYNLRLTAPPPPPDSAGNSTSRARNLNTLGGTRTFSDFVGDVDTQDYYRFVLDSRRDFSLLLDGMAADADVQLLNSAGSVITSSTRSGNNPDSITRTLDAGTYFVRVYRHSEFNTNYSLRLTAPPPPTDFAGNSISAARNLNALSDTRTFSDFVGNADAQDYYRFVLASRRDFSLLLDGMAADADVQLLNSAGSVITSSTRSGNNPESITRTLDAGTYFVRVYPAGGGNTNYNLRLTAPPPPTDFAGNSISAARNLNALSGTRIFSDFVGDTDPQDYYRFVLDSRRDFSLLLDGMTADADVELLDSSGSSITSSTSSGNNPDSITRTLDAGTYFLRIYRTGNTNTNYNLSLTANSIAPPGGIDERNATLARDVLTGTSQQRSNFTFANLSYSLPEQYDQITNYESADRIRFLNQLYNSTINSALQVNDVIGLIQLGSAAQQLAPNTAIAFQVGQNLISQVISQLLPSGASPQVVESLTPPTPGTFVAINDGVVGFDPQADSILFLRNYFPSPSNPVSIL